MGNYPSAALQCPLMADFMARRKEITARLKRLVETRTDNAYADRAIVLIVALLQGR